jgi:hypothetical protein
LNLMPHTRALLLALTTCIAACYVADEPPATPHRLTVAKLGCFRDQDGGGQGRDLDGLMMSMPNMTTEICTETCAVRGFPFAGTQDSVQCFCGARYGRTGTSDACNMRCGGNPNETCGGFWANLVYQVR